MKYALMNEEADILEKGKVKSPGKKDTVESFFAVIDEIVEKYPGIDGIAISSPGIINSTQGVIDVVGVFPYLQKLPLTQMFQDGQIEGVELCLSDPADFSRLDPYIVRE